MMSEELHAKILAFLSGEFKREGPYACTRLDLVFSAGSGYRDEEIQSWVRAETPELFDTLALVEKLTSQVIERAYSHADSYGEPKSYRYVLRTIQHLHGRATWSFSVKPSGTLAIQQSGDDAGQLTAIAGGPRQPVDALVHALNTQTRNSREMYQGTVNALVATNKQALDENMTLKQRVRELERALDDAQSTRMEREWAINQQVRKAERTDAGFAKLLQMAQIIASRLMLGEGASAGAVSGLATLIAQFGHSLRPDQIQQLIAVLDMPQRLMFQEIMSMAQGEAEKTQAAGGGGEK